jgi:hypothetical protein
MQCMDSRLRGNDVLLPQGASSFGRHRYCHDAARSARSGQL